VKCTNCDSTKGIAYHGIEGGSDAVKAESCDECHTYRKIGYQDKDLEFEPLADDLASLTLDLLMGEAGYRRAVRIRCCIPKRLPSNDAHAAHERNGTATRAGFVRRVRQSGTTDARALNAMLARSGGTRDRV
jgi:hypothetical protein